MSKKIKSILALFLLTFFIVTSINITALSYVPAKAAVVVPKVQYVSAPKLEYTVGDRVQFNLNAPNYGGRVQYRVVLWKDATKSYSDLWNTSDRYYTNWQPYGNETFTLGWPISEPGSYRITIYAKRAGVPNNQTALKGYNCDSYMESAAFVVKAKDTAFQPYKVTITTAALNIRKGPSTSTSIVGSYSGGTLVDVIGESGDFLQTSLGYIAKEYTQKYTAPSRGDSEPVVYTDYIQVTEDTPLLLDVDGTADERYAVKGKTYGVIESVNGYYKIKVGKVYGYIPVSKTALITTTPKNKISLAWQYVYSKSSNSTYYNDSSDYVRRSSADLGLDVISPTWFYMTGDTASNINAAEKADREYVKIAHRNGYEVWALFQEFNKDRAYKTFYDSTVKNRVINQIVSFALQYNVDGVNIDYEGLGGIPANKDGFTAFVRDLSAQLKAVGLSVSVDVVKPTVGSVYSSFTDRPALASYTDYLIYMAYDEHYAGAKTAGSVGSFPWVETGLKDIIAQGVPKEKIILGVPFYLRDFTVQNAYQPYDAVIFSQDGRLYASPFDYTNKLLDINPGYAYKYLETANDWYKVELEGETAYIPKSNSILAGANTNLKTVDASLNIVFPYDAVVTKAQSIVYMQPSETSSIIGSINPGYAYKSIEAVNGWYKINYNGTDAYVMQGSVTFLPKFSSISTLENTSGIMVPNETVIIKSETGLYRSPTIAEGEKVADIKVGDSFKYLGIASGMSDWYIVDYNGKRAYAHKDYTTFISANTTTSSTVVKSSSVSLQSTLDKVKQYGGWTYYDSAAKQNVAQYYNEGYWHMVWLEDTHSMGWRMDLVNNYGLAGAAGWELGWNPSGDMLYVIKSKLK